MPCRPARPFLAYMPAPAFARFLGGPLERFTPNTITDAGELLARLDRIRAEGVAWVREEFDVGINSAAAVVLGKGDRPVAAIHVHGPSYRFPRPPAHEARGADRVERASATVNVAPTATATQPTIGRSGSWRSVKMPSAMNTPPISASPTTCRAPVSLRHQCPASP